MAAFVFLLRAVNVGGTGRVPMAELRAHLEAMRFTKVKTLLQSGNVVCTGETEETSALEKRLELAAAKRWQPPVDFFVRNAAEWRAILAGNPFRQEAIDAPNRLHVMFLRDAPQPPALAALKAAIAGQEYFHARGRELYLYYPEGMGQSRFTGSVIERKLGTRGTARNWNTLQKIAALLVDA